MIIAAKYENDKFRPIVILDHTRTDDQFSESEIYDACQQMVGEILRILGYDSPANPIASDVLGEELYDKKKIEILTPEIYSLDYNIQYKHTAISFGDSKRTQLVASIINAPNDLVGILQIQEVVKSENIPALVDQVKRVVAKEIVFPMGITVVRDMNRDLVRRHFTIYATPYEADRLRLNNKLMIYGGAYDDVVIRANAGGVAILIKKGEKIIDVLNSKIKNIEFVEYSQVAQDNDYVTVEGEIFAKKENLYPPAPLNETITKICIDNDLMYRYDVDGGIPRYSFWASGLTPPDKPHATMSFHNSVKGSILVSNFTLSNYATANITCELFDIELFRTIVIYDDSRSNIFYNLNKAGKQKQGFEGYNFYVMSYEIVANKNATVLNIVASNNWLLSYTVKVDAIFSNAVYRKKLLEENRKKEEALYDDRGKALKAFEKTNTEEVS